MPIAIVPIVLMLVGGLLYGLTANAKVQEIGRLTFAAGVFAFAFTMRTFSL